MRMREIICPDLHRILLEKASGVFRRVFRTGIHGVAEAPQISSQLLKSRKCTRITAMCADRP